MEKYFILNDCFLDEIGRVQGGMAVVNDCFLNVICLMTCFQVQHSTREHIFKERRVMVL